MGAEVRAAATISHTTGNRTAVRSKSKEASMGLVITLIGAIAPLPVVQPRSAGHVGPAMTSIALEVHPGQRKVDAS
jgi:hypothetical protein